MVMSLPYGHRFLHEKHFKIVVKLGIATTCVKPRDGLQP